MGLAGAEDMSLRLVDAESASLCRCGHCRALISVHEGHRRVRCASCGRANAVPTYVYVVCERCGQVQRRRFRRRHTKPYCRDCGHTLPMGEIGLRALQHRVQRRSRSGRRMSARESVAFALLLYALVFLVFLLWLGQK